MKKSVKVIPSMFMLIGVMCAIVIGLGLLIFFYTYPPARPTELYDHLLTCFATGILPVLIIILAIPRGIFSVVTISESGVKRASFGVLCKREIKWDEMSEMRYYPRIMPFVFLCKTGTLEGVYYDDIIKRKDVIQVTLTKKVYNAITQFTDKEIMGLSDDAIKALKLDKH